MFKSIYRYLAHCRKNVDFLPVNQNNIASLSTPMVKISATLHSQTGDKQPLPKPAVGYKTFLQEQQCHNSARDVHSIRSSSKLEMKTQADNTKDNNQKLTNNDELCKQRNESLIDSNDVYISEPWPSTEPESILEFPSIFENRNEFHDMVFNDLMLHDVEEVSHLYGSNTNMSLKATNPFALNHMPDFRHVKEIYYTVTRKKLLRRKVDTLFRNSSYKRTQGTGQKLIRHGHTVMYCCPAEVVLSIKILKELGVSPQQLVKNLDLLVQPSVVLKARGQLVQDLGLYSSTPILCLSRLDDLMEVPEAELIEHNFLKPDSSLLERLLSKLGSGYVLEEKELRHQLSRANTMKETYNKILARLLAQRFAVSVTSTEEVLRHYQPTYKPLSHYHLIADIIVKHLGLSFEQVRQQPALLDLFPQDTLALLQQRPLVAGRTTVEALCACPHLGTVPHTLLQRWLRLLDAHDVLQFPLDGVVPWVLKQDLLVMAKLVLEFLVHHPQWQNIKSSDFLFEIFANPGVMNELMKDVQGTTLLNNCSTKRSPEDGGRWHGAAAAEARRGELQGAASRWGYDTQQGEEGARGASDGEDSDQDTDGSPVAVAEEPVQDDTRRLSLLSADRLFEALPADLLDVSDKYVTGYTPGNNDLTFCSKKNQPNAEVKSYLQTQLKIEASEVNRVGRHGASPCFLPDAIAKLQLLLQHGYSRQQIAAAVEIFGYDEDLVSRELSLLPHRYTNYDAYWRRHPNVVNLLLYYVTKETKNAACDANLE